MLTGDISILKKYDGNVLRAFDRVCAIQQTVHYAHEEITSISFPTSRWERKLMRSQSEIGSEMKNYSCFFVCLVDALTLTPFNLVPNVPLGTEANALPIRDWERDEKLFVFFRVLSGRLNIDSF
jgi:hypothetical protein